MSKVWLWTVLNPGWVRVSKKEKGRRLVKKTYELDEINEEKCIDKEWDCRKKGQRKTRAGWKKGTADVGWWVNKNIYKKSFQKKKNKNKIKQK